MMTAPALNIKWNLSIIQRLKILHQKNRLAHAYLLIGPSGIGKVETAYAVAQMLNCHQPDSSEEGFCGNCSVCLKIKNRNHPDVHFIESGFGETIKIDQIRDLLSQLQLRPFEAQKKVFILKNVENLTIEGANALLKSLEEPATNSLLVLTSTVPEKIPETVRSRCHSIYFSAESQKQLEARIKGEKGLSNKDAHFLTCMAQGSMGKALELKDKNLTVFKDQIIKEFILNRPEEAFLTKILAEKEKTKDFLDVLLSWVRDCLIKKANVSDDQLIHVDYLDELEQFHRRFTFSELNELRDEVIHMYKMLTENLNIKIPLLIIKERLWVN